MRGHTFVEVLVALLVVCCGMLLQLEVRRVLLDDALDEPSLATCLAKRRDHERREAGP